MLLCSEQLNQKWKVCSLQRRQEEGRNRIYFTWLFFSLYRLIFLECFLGFSFAIDFNLSYLKDYFPTLANYFYLPSFFSLLLCLSGIKFIFLIIFHVVLCFRFVTKCVLIIQECISYCWTLLAEYQDTICFLFCFSQVIDWRQAREIL